MTDQNTLHLESGSKIRFVNWCCLQLLRQARLFEYHADTQATVVEIS